MWTITGIIWSFNLGYQVCEKQKSEYISFLEFLNYTQLCIIKKGELNAKSKRIDESKKHKGE
jgi:hypothetical protein